MNDEQLSSHNVIYNSNQEMLSYFNNIYLESLEKIQALKDQIFELDIKIEELQKTKSIYAFKSSSRRNVFAPIASDSLMEDETNFIQNQIKDLEANKASVEETLRSTERSNNITKKRLAMLQEAETAISEAGLADGKDIATAVVNPDSDGLEFVVHEDSTDTTLAHGYNILMQDAFDKSFISTMLSNSVIDGISKLDHKFDMLPYLMNSDINRAKLTLDEIRKETETVKSFVSDLIAKIDLPIDTSKPICNSLNDYILSLRSKHSDCKITANVECASSELVLHPVFAINTFRLLNIFFDNVFKHSNANAVNLKLSLTPNIIDVTITDNGIGIKDGYMENSAWYSGLHKAKEIIYLLNGTFDIHGDTVSGTTVRFGFSVRA